MTDRFNSKDPKPFPLKEFSFALFFAIASSAIVYYMFREQIDAWLFVKIDGLSYKESAVIE